MFLLSPPSRWCGLKFSSPVISGLEIDVTTFAVVWIEMLPHVSGKCFSQSHHLRGGVD